MASTSSLCLIGFMLASQVIAEAERIPLRGLSSIRSRPPNPSTGSSSKPPATTQCGETRKNLKDGDFGMIESPGYPRNYKGGLDCDWKIEDLASLFVYDLPDLSDDLRRLLRNQGEPGTVIQATVFDLITETSFLSDASDSLYVTLNGNWTDSQRFSGDLNAITPLVLVSEQNSLGFRFRSSRFTEGNKGFRIGYYTRATQTGKPAVTEPGHDVYVVVVCQFVPVDHGEVWPEKGESLRQLPEPDTTNQTNPNPFLVALVLDDQQFCSGTLVSNRHVVTSAHCTRGVQKIGMVFGTDNILVADDNVQRRVAFARSVTEHPYFDPYTGANDLSVIELEEPVEINKYVVPAVIPGWSYIGTTFGGFRGEIAGWGDSKSGTVYTTAASKRITISPNAACTNNRGHNGLSMCSRAVRNSSCQADSGSPIITRGGYCSGPVNNENNGDNGINNVAQKPPKQPQNKPQQKPNKPNKPSSSKPSKPNHRPYYDSGDDGPKYQANVLLGVVSYGSCDLGFSFTRITAYLDFLTRTIGPAQTNSI